MSNTDIRKTGKPPISNFSVQTTYLKIGANIYCGIHLGASIILDEQIILGCRLHLS